MLHTICQNLSNPKNKLQVESPFNYAPVAVVELQKISEFNPKLRRVSIKV